MYYVYVLKSLKNGRYYTGSTCDIERRLLEHMTGKSKATKHLRPFRLVFAEEFDTRTDAYKRERYLKTGKGREDREVLIAKHMGA
ncbi:MAG: GIY-YIG nuclease family protein [Candidatus Margulisiibacteriota bacterium]